MIELLVVIAIIAILVSITAVVVVKVKAKAKSASASAEIAQIANAIGAFKAKTNVAYIPSGSPPWTDSSGNTKTTFRLCSTYLDNSNNPLPWPEVVYLKQVFPAMRLDDNGLRVGGAPVANSVATPPAGSIPMIELDNNQTLVFFLTGGPPTLYQGFSTNRQQPFETTATNRIGPFLAFPANKYATGAAAVTALHASANASTVDLGAASLVDPWGSPYAYFAFSPNVSPPGYMGTAFTFRGTSAMPYYQTDATGRRLYLNQRGFQIVSAGENGQEDVAPYGFGGGGAWVPGVGDYAESGPGFDDVSNFHEGKLGVQ
jgi:type II secretory pathway pseudopilin PulG